MVDCYVLTVMCCIEEGLKLSTLVCIGTWIFISKDARSAEVHKISTTRYTKCQEKNEYLPILESLLVHGIDKNIYISTLLGDIHTHKGSINTLRRMRHNSCFTQFKNKICCFIFPNRMFKVPQITPPNTLFTPPQILCKL